MMFKNLSVYRLGAFAVTAEQLHEMLLRDAFAPATPSERERTGWTAPREGGLLVHGLNRQLLLTLRTETKILPAASVLEVAKARAAEMEEAQGFYPGKKAMKELKERVADELLPRCLSKYAMTGVWIDPVNGWLVVDTASTARADHVVKCLLRAVDKFPLESLRVARSPVAMMTAWLDMDEAPAGFTVDQDCELRATGESKAAVVFKRHALDVADIRRHIAAGKQCTKLALTWRGKISFVLDETLAIKRVTPLDLIRETDATTRNNDERFDNDFMLMSGEYAAMLTDLVLALGGEAHDGIKADITTDGRFTVDTGGRAGAFTFKVRATNEGFSIPATEKHVKLAAKLYEARTAAQHLLGEDYHRKMAFYLDIVKTHMVNLGETAIEAATTLANDAAGDGHQQLFYLAAAVELVEPSAKAAA